jgi:hypothetical protein
MVVDELEIQEDTEGVLRAIPVSPLELEEAFPDDAGTPPPAVPLDGIEEEVPRAIPVEAGEFEAGP